MTIMKRRLQDNDGDDGGGLDSLLDTMTNVVGILVMILIATQLGVKDAVSRISKTEAVKEEDIKNAQEKLLLTKIQRDAIQLQLADLKPADESEIKVKLANLRRQRDQTRTNLNQEQQLVNQYAIKIEQDTKKADAAKKKTKELADSKALKKKLQESLKKDLEDEARLKALLDDTPVQKAPPSKVVTLPDPRPAPPGLSQVTFLCAYNKVYLVYPDDLRDQIRKKAEFLVNRNRLYGGPAVGVNQERFMKEYNKKNRLIRGKLFDVELYASDIYPRLKFIPKKNKGATIREVINPRSNFQKMLNSINKQKYYARYIVLPDSYEVYLAARAVSKQKRLLAGWDPQAETWQYTTSLGGKILFGPKPPPPKPNPNPAPPAKPRNVID